MVLARVVNVLLGLWLVISAFLWPHERASMLSTVILGCLCIIFAIMALIWPASRYLNTVLSIVLFVLGFAIARYENATVWNNVLVAILIFIVSLAPPGRTLWPRQPQPV